MKYFLHDTNAFNDEKVTELFINYGFEGVGLFYVILERLASQEKPIKTKVLKTQLKVGKRLEKCWQFMEEIDMISSNNGETFNERILSYSETYKIKKEKTAEKVRQWRERQSITENVTSYETVSNPPKVNKSKVNIESGAKPAPVKKIFIKPDVFETTEFFISLGLDEFTAQGQACLFMDYYNSNGWKVGKNPMKDWEAAARSWKNRMNNYSNSNNGTYKQSINGNGPKPGTSASRLEALRNF
jgi:hypothetical protein